MGVISLTLPSDGDTIDASDVNTPFNTIATVINGNLDTDNLSPSAGIKSTQLNFGGSGAGVWWEEVGRTTLGSAGDNLSVTVSARKYLKLLVAAYPTGGTIRAIFRFNSDTGNNYAHRYYPNAGAEVTAASQSAGILNTATASSTPLYVTLDVINISAQEKLAHGFYSLSSSAGAASAPNISRGMFKWANTSAQITTVLALNDGTGDFDTGSEIVVLGHN